MKPAPAPRVPGNTDAERFHNAVRKMFSIPKDLVLKKEAAWKRAHEKKRAAKKPA
jgi:hypothetical protein